MALVPSPCGRRIVPSAQGRWGSAQGCRRQPRTIWLWVRYPPAYTELLQLSHHWGRRKAVGVSRENYGCRSSTPPPARIVPSAAGRRGGVDGDDIGREQIFALTLSTPNNDAIYLSGSYCWSDGSTG